MKIVFFTKYNRDGASSRYRSFNYSKFLDEENTLFDFSPLFYDGYVNDLYNSRKKIFKIILSYLKRIVILIFTNKRKTFFVIEKELFPGLPYFIEKYFLRKNNYSIDYDDAVFVRKRNIPILRNKHLGLTQNARFVTVGNKWYFTQLPQANCFYLPTVVDEEKYPAPKQKKNDKVRICWIGTPTNLQYLEYLLPVFREMKHEGYDYKLRVIGCSIVDPLLDIENLGWQEELEYEFLSTCDIGVMPLFNSDWEKGKCGFKLLQYMAAGLPVVGSPSPVNSEIIFNGINGFIANNHAEWKKYLTLLFNNHILRAKMGENGRNRVFENYTYQIWGRIYAKKLNDTLHNKPKKIAILLNTSWYIYNFRKNLITELQNNGYEIYAIAPFDNYTEKLEELGCKYFHVEINSKSKNPIYDLILIWRIRKILSHIRPDILLNFTIKPNIYGSIAARTLGIKCINNVAGMGTLFTDGFISRVILKSLFRISQLKVSTVFFQNPDDLKELTKTKIIDVNKACLLPGSGVNLIEFNYAPVIEKENNQIDFLLLARMIYPKGIVEIAEAGKLLREKGYTNFNINLLGELGINNPQAISESELDNICKPSYITYLGKTDDVKTFIKNSDVVVLPSYYREGTPKSLLEALGIWRPIITTNMPGCKETVIDGVNGFLCEPKSVEGLAIKMEKILNLDYSQRIKMGRQSRILAESRFDEKIVINKYIEKVKLIF